MPTPSPEIMQLLSVFAVAMTAPTFAKSLVFINQSQLAELFPGTYPQSDADRVRGGESRGIVEHHPRSDKACGKTPRAFAFRRFRGIIDL
jgi:hypothetical protein